MFEEFDEGIAVAMCGENRHCGGGLKCKGIGLSDRDIWVAENYLVFRRDHRWLLT